MKELIESIVRGDCAKAMSLTENALENNTNPKDILNNGLIPGMEEIGKLFAENKIFIPEVIFAAKAMKEVLEFLEPILIKTDNKPLGKILIGTVQGDQHDIGKNLVVIMCRGAGFEVVDLGVDVSKEEFARHIEKDKNVLVGLSAMLTTTLVNMEGIVKAVKQVNPETKVIIGGAPANQEYADKISADGYALDAASAVQMFKKCITG